MSALDIKQADYVQIRDCTTCGHIGKTTCPVHICIAPGWAYWKPKPMPESVTTSSSDPQPEPSVRHIYICTRFDTIRNAEFCVAERLGNVPLIPQLMYQTYLDDSDECERETARLASLDLIGKEHTNCGLWATPLTTTCATRSRRRCGWRYGYG